MRLELDRVGAGLGRGVDQPLGLPDRAVVVVADLGDDEDGRVGPTLSPAISTTITLARWLDQRADRHGSEAARPSLPPDPGDGVPRDGLPSQPQDERTQPAPAA